MLPEGCRIGVVEDDPIMGESLLQRLTLEGCDVDWWTTGREAMSGLQSLRHDLVICDIRLPDMEGDAFVRALAKRHGPVPVVFLSGHISAEAKAAMETEPQVRAILPKPWDEEQLLAILTEIIDAFPTLS